MDTKNREIEVRFLEIDVEALKKKLVALGATDLDPDLLREVIFYDKEGKWKYDEKKFVRIRTTKEGVFVAFKHNEETTATGTKEIEFMASDAEKVKDFLEEVGLVLFREQEKKRHKFKLGEVIVDIDTWPKVPTYVELEGPSEEALRDAAAKLEFDWTKVVFETGRFVIERYYHIPVSELKFFTFDRIE